MLSAIEIVQWVYSEADPAHIEELLLCNESQLAVIIASCCGDIRFRHDASDVMLGLDGAGTTGAPPHFRLPQDGVFHRIVGEALAGGARSVLWHVQIPGRGDWLIVACGGTFDGSASAFLVVGRVEPRRTYRGATLSAIIAATTCIEPVGGPAAGEQAEAPTATGVDPMS
jgi:hypothetical protein